MSSEPYEQQEQLSPQYYPNLPMFHYLTKLLRFHGLYFDDHVLFRQVRSIMDSLNVDIVLGPRRTENDERKSCTTSYWTREESPVARQEIEYQLFVGR